METGKVQQLVDKMTFGEKAALLTYAAANTLDTAAIERLGIPALEMADGPHGLRGLHDNHAGIDGGSVCFPTASALGATWNRKIAYSMGAALARECAVQGIDLLLAPGVNMKRTPLCGRNFEYLSEDPVLSGELAAAYVRGLQDNGTGACVKHFAANNQETLRLSISAEADERTLRELYLRVFEIVLEKSDPVCVMGAYNKLNGIKAAENPWLMTQVLRDEWGYAGAVVSDWNAVWNAPRAVAAGTDLIMPHRADIEGELKSGLNEGTVTPEQIDRAAARVLEMVFRVRELRQGSISPGVYDRQAQHESARHIAEEAITLLKNEDDILPLDKSRLKRIGVIGACAQAPLIQGGGSSLVPCGQAAVETPLSCIERLAGDDIEVIYVDTPFPYAHMNGYTYKARKLGGEVDVMLVFIGEYAGYEAEGMDRTSIRFSPYIDALFEFADALTDNIVVVMQSGSAMAPFRWQHKIKGILQMWLCGEAGGGALADILFGNVNPSGKLSETFMLELDENLDFPGTEKVVRYTEGTDAGYRYYDRHPEKVWYPFGHGLSYTDFAYSDLTVSPMNGDSPDTPVTVSCRITNTGTRRGKETVQLYVSDTVSAVYRPLKELGGFEKVELEPGESADVVFHLDKRSFAYYNPMLHDWIAEAGDYALMIGASCADIRLRGTYRLEQYGQYSLHGANQKIIW